MSNSMAIAYLIIVAALAAAYTNGALDPAFASTIFRDSVDMAVFAVIALLGAAAIFMGGMLTPICACGAFGSLFVLTVHQDPLIRYLSLGAVLFSIGMYGMVVSRNAVRVLMSIELMLNAVNINLVAFSRYVDPGELRGQAFAIFVLTVAAAEAAVGLAIVLAIYRNTATVDMDRFNLLKW